MLCCFHSFLFNRKNASVVDAIIRAIPLNVSFTAIKETFWCMASVDVEFSRVKFIAEDAFGCFVDV